MLMEFDDIKQAVKYAIENNMDVKRQESYWIAFDKESKPIEEIIDDTSNQLLEQLSLTKADVFLAIYKDKGITPEQIRSQITDPEGLIQFDYAKDYYRGNPLIDQLGEKLGYTKEDLDYLFQHKIFKVKETEV